MSLGRILALESVYHTPQQAETNKTRKYQLDASYCYLLLRVRGVPKPSWYRNNTHAPFIRICPCSFLSLSLILLAAGSTTQERAANTAISSLWLVSRSRLVFLRRQCPDTDLRLFGPPTIKSPTDRRIPHSYVLLHERRVLFLWFSPRLAVCDFDGGVSHGSSMSVSLTSGMGTFVEDLRCEASFFPVYNIDLRTAHG